MLADRNARWTLCGGLLAAWIMATAVGCSSMRWSSQRQSALSPGLSKEELIEHLNQNVLGSDSQPGLAAWQSTHAHVTVSNMPPVPIPASIAVEAPRNFRLLVSRPTGAQEVDIGSNDDVLWIWTRDEPDHVLTVSHTDVPLAMRELQMPVEIHPDWLMQVFGVVPLRAQDFKLQRDQKDSRMLELVATQQSSFGEDVERVVRVDLKQGRVVEHALRLPGKKVLVRATLEQYQRLPSGTELPGVYRLEWPDAQMEMAIHIRQPEVNPVSLGANKSLWQVPVRKGMEVVDMGAVARRQRMPQQRPKYEGLFDEVPGKIQLTHGPAAIANEAPRPSGFPVSPAINHAAAGDAPAWALPKER